MDKAQLADLFASLHLPKTGYYIASGGALVLYGLRKRTNDLDLYVDPELFTKLSAEYHIDPADTDEYNSYHIKDGRVQILIDEHPEKSSIWLDGYLVETLESILKFKLWRNAPKDQPDIAKIQNYLKINKDNVN